MVVGFTMNGTRKDAMLTSTDREFLKNEGEYYTGENAKQQRYERRSNIRKRIESTLEDFGVLLENLSEKERDKLFGEYSGPVRREFNDQNVRDGVVNALAFLLTESGVTNHMGMGRTGSDLYHGVMLEALRKVGEKEGYLVQSFEPESIEAERMPGRELQNKLERGEQLSPAETRYLIEREGLQDEIQERLREQLLDD